MIIDLQNAIDHPDWGRRNNLDAEANAGRLLQAWRTSGRPIFHVKHNSVHAASHYRPGQPGNDFKPGFAPQSGEPVIEKTTNSAFIGTTFEQTLQSQGIETLVFAGVITNNSVEASVRMAGNLGFSAYLAEDACFTFDKPDWRGVLRTAEEVHAMSLANMDGEYCTVVSTADLVGAA